VKEEESEAKEEGSKEGVGGRGEEGFGIQRGCASVEKTQSSRDMKSRGENCGRKEVSTKKIVRGRKEDEQGGSNI
jgi:hypothetical protein